MITKDQLLATDNATIEERKYLCEQSFELFILYYFTEYIQYSFAPFHFDMFEDLVDLQTGKINELLWIIFGEGAKTSIAKIFLVYVLCYEKRFYINVDAFDKTNAETILFDVVLALQTNQKIIQDFGQLYNTKRTPDEVQRKKVSDFITNTGIRVEAHSTQESVRGRLYKQHRPDFFYVEDFETVKTAVSDAYTDQVVRHLKELQRGLGQFAWVLYAANYISDRGSVQSLVDRAGGDPRFRVRNVPVIENDKPTWPSKYAMTDKEASETGKISLEERKRKLKERFAPEMMNDPSSSELAFFNRSVINALIARSTQPMEVKGSARYYYKYNPSHRYAIGADTSMGIGKDNNADALIDFTTIPARVPLVYENNEISPDVFAFELKRQGDEFGTCLVAPEVNSESGGTCVNQLRNIYDLGKIYRRIPRERISDHMTGRIGWETNAATKPEILYQLKSAVDDGLLEILDIRLLQLLRSFVFSQEIHVPDLIMALAIAWEMRNYALVSPAMQGAGYKQPEYERPGFDSENRGSILNEIQEEVTDFTPHRR